MKPKTKIVIASLLKPVDDSRMFEKFGLSLSNTNRFDIHIIGFEVDAKIPHHLNIQFHPIFKFSRISWKRFMAPWKYYKILLKVKPDLIIVNPPDLQAVTVLFKILFGAKILYDVQENYFLNILYAGSFKPLFRPFLAGIVRLQEILISPFVTHFFLAEKIYSSQLPFIGKRFSIIENKYQPSVPITNKSKVKIEPRKTLNLLFSGTLSRHYGVIDAIQITNEISNHHPVSLKIIGRCANTGFFSELKAYTADHEHVKLIAGEDPVNHQEIVEAIKTADMGIISYLPNKSTKGRIPTKVYEYMANQLPFLVLHNPDWLGLAHKYHACLPIKPEIAISDLLHSLFNATFYDVKESYDELLWQYEEEKLLSVISRLVERESRPDR